MTKQAIEDTSYNGWKNYPTWNIALWFSNDVALYNKWIIVSKLLASMRGGRKQTRNAWESGMAHYFSGLEIMARFGNSETPDGVDFNDKSIDWVEIAEAWSEDMKDYDWNAQTDKQVS